jgi:flagellar protein FliL
VAEESAAPKESPSGGGGQKPILFVVLIVLNMLFIAGVGFMLFKNKQKEAAEPKIEDVIHGEADTQHKEASEDKVIIGKVIPLETFIVNLSGSKGRRIAKVNMELEIDSDAVQDEIEKRKAQIRDIIIIILSSKTYEEIAERGGKDQLKEEVKDTVNGFLTKGKISNVYFTEFLYNN